MQQSVCSQASRRPRTLMLALAAAIGVVVALPGLASAFPPSPVPMPSSSPTPTPTPVVTNLSVTVTGFTDADATADVTSNGGAPPIYDRGFVYAPTVDNPDPQYGGPSTLLTFVPGTIGPMARPLNGLLPNVAYSIQAFAHNPGEYGYSGVSTFSTACPVYVLPNVQIDGSVGTYYEMWVTPAYGTNFGLDTYNYLGTLPPGVDLYGNGDSGYLSGTPTTTGTFTFTVFVDDAYYATGCGGSRTYSVTIDALRVDNKKLDFPSEVVGNTSPPKTVIIQNDSAVDVPLSLPFAFPASFAESGTNNCTDPLAAGNYCSLDVVFAPTATGPVSGTLDIGPLVISMRGTGTSSAAAQIYVSNYQGSSVSVIDPITNVVRNKVDVGANPFALTALPGGGKVYVPNYNSSTVSVISATDYSVATIGVTAPFVAASTPAGDEIWVGSLNNPYYITVIETVGDTVTQSIPYWSSSYCNYGVWGIVANPTNHEMYVISTDGNVCVFDRLTHAYVRAISVGGSPTSGVILPDGSALYVNDSLAGTVARVDLPGGAITSVPGVQGYRMDITADGSRVYLAATGGGFGYIKTATNGYTQIPLAGADSPYGVAVDDAAGRVYVTDRNTNSVHVVGLSTDAEIPNPALPMFDSSFVTPEGIAVIKPNVAPTGVVPVVTSLANGAPAGFSTSVSADVASVLPVFERGFAYAATSSGLDPMPGAPGVVTVVVSGTTGAMGTTLAPLNANTDYTYRAYAKNFAGVGVSATGTFTTAATVCNGISISGATFPNGMLGAPYGPVTLTASGDGPPPYTHSVSFGALPPGITLVGDTISGTPTAAGYYEFQIRTTVDATGCFATGDYSFTIGTPVALGDVVISEFRTRGVSGPLDEYVEIANRTSADIVVASQDGSGGWSLGRPGIQAAYIEDGTVIPKGGHWLAMGNNFSLYYYGYPDWVGNGAAALTQDIPDDAGVALFATAEPANYDATTLLDAVGGTAETDPLFFEGTALTAVVQDDGLGTAINPPAQTAWVRRATITGALSDTDSNDRDFVFVATDAGTAYGPSAGTPVAAVLGAPNPEDSHAVHDVDAAELPASLLDPSKGQDRYPNREVEFFNAVEYRRKLTNNTGKDITFLAFKVINLTTVNSKKMVGASLQGQLAAESASSFNIEWPVGSNNFVDVSGSQLDYPSMYNFFCCGALGGMNSRVVIPLGGSSKNLAPRDGFKPEASQILSSGGLPAGDTIAVNIRARIWSPGYYLFVIEPQVSFDPPPSCSDCVKARDAGPAGSQRPAAAPSRQKN